MAERRMFAKAITNSARFLRMPATARLLYYDLGMAADDDGITEAFSVMRTTGATEDDLRVLASRGYVQILNDDLVSYIPDWKVNNRIRKDRYRKSIYRRLLDIACNVQLLPGNQPATNGQPWQPEDNQPATNGQPTDISERKKWQPTDNHVDDGRLSQVRLGKDRLGEDSPDRAGTNPRRDRGECVGLLNGAIPALWGRGLPHMMEA